jgi:hypothetical protein
MKNLTTVSRLACLTIVLAAGTMMATANIATAKDNHHQSNNVQNNGHQHGTMSGRPARVKTALREQKKCLKHCGKPTQTSTQKKPTTTSPKPAVSEQPATAKSAASSPPTTATISNGVGTSAIFNGKDGLTVTAASPTSITVTNSSHSSVTMGGESITLSGAASVKAGPGMEVRRLANGDVTIAIKPAVAGAPTRPIPPGVGPGDIAKGAATTAGSAANVVGTSPVILGTAAGITAAGAVAATIAGEPVKGTKQIASEVADSAGAAIEWVADWF